MSSDYGYINARVKAMKSRLLARETLYELLGARDLAVLADILGSTDYSRDLQEALTHGSGLPALEEGFRRNLCRTTAKLLEIADGEPGELLEVIIERWDLENIKAVLRGKHNRLSKEEILSSIVPAGRLDEVRVSELAGAEDAKAVADMLATWHSPFARALTRALPAYLQDNDLPATELALDRFYFMAGLETVSTGDGNAAVVRGVLQEQLDAVNLRTVLRLRGVTLEEERLKGYWVGEGGRITAGKFVALSRIENISQALDRAHLSVQLSEKPGDEAALENALSRALSFKHAKLFWGDPLRINVPIGYLWMKTIEVTNLRLIARGKAYGLAQLEIERELLLFLRFSNHGDPSF